MEPADEITTARDGMQLSVLVVELFIFVVILILFALLMFLLYVNKCTMWRLPHSLTANTIWKSFLTSLTLQKKIQTHLAVSIGHV